LTNAYTYDIIYLCKQKKGGVFLGTARTRASLKYNQKAYDFMRITVKKGELARLKEIAKSQGKSLNKFVTDVVYKEVDNIRKSV